jgi:hypothetical protein
MPPAKSSLQHRLNPLPLTNQVFHPKRVLLGRINSPTQPGHSNPKPFADTDRVRSKRARHPSALLAEAGLTEQLSPSVERLGGLPGLMQEYFQGGSTR